MAQDGPPVKAGGFQWGEDRFHEASADDQVDHLRGRLDEIAAKQLEADAVADQVAALDDRLDDVQATVAEGFNEGDDANFARLESELEDFRQTLHFILDLVTVPLSPTEPEAEE